MKFYLLFIYIKIYFATDKLLSNEGRMNYTIAALYLFVPLRDPISIRQKMIEELAPLNLCGTLLIAPEGINGTLAGSTESVENMLALLGRYFGLTRREVKFSYTDEKPFKRFKIRLKQEIVTFRQPEADPNLRVGVYVSAADWNALISDPDVLVIDTRNRYETMIGSFIGAKVPKIDRFTEFADFVRAELDPKRHTKIAMFCTGGIRCEKASAFMLAEGFPEVYHLKGGILKYLEDVPFEESRWQGECYVFDRRMAVGHGLTPGRYSMCFCCGYPLDEDDKLNVFYEEGVSCGHCHANTSDEDKSIYRRRHQQMTKQGW